MNLSVVKNSQVESSTHFRMLSPLFRSKRNSLNKATLWKKRLKLYNKNIKSKCKENLIKHYFQEDLPLATEPSLS